jgi:CheY-like chemotaxis protein
MSCQFPFDQIASLREDAQLLVRRANDHELQLESLVAAAEHDVQFAQRTVAHSAESCDDELRDLLSVQLQRSAENAATVRNLCLSARQQHVAAARLLTDLDGDAGAPEQRPRRHAVLVVDDHEDIRDLVARVLQGAGFLVSTASNGLEALIAAYEIRPSVIVMDVTMPVLDGIEATRLIKAAEATRHARVIAYTGNPALDTRVVDLFAAVLSKPAPLEVVVATVRHVADGGCGCTQ